MNESPQGTRTIINRCCKRRSKSMKPYIGMMKRLLHSYRLQTSQIFCFSLLQWKSGIPEELVSIELNAPFDHLLSADIYVGIFSPCLM